MVAEEKEVVFSMPMATLLFVLLRRWQRRQQLQRPSRSLPPSLLSGAASATTDSLPYARPLRSLSASAEDTTTAKKKEKDEEDETWRLCCRRVKDNSNNNL